MIGLTNLDFYNSIFNKTEENNKFELYKFPDEKSGGVTYEKVRDEIGKDLDIEDITAADFRDEIKAPIFIEEYRKQVTKRMKNVQYMKIVAGYVSSVFQDFESHLRTEVDLIEDDFKLALDEYNSSFITYEISPGIHNFKDISEALFNILQIKYPGPTNVIDIEYDVITMKIKLVVRSEIIVIRFDEKSFFSSLLGFTPGWVYKHYIKYISQKIVNLSSTIKINLKCDCIDGCFQDGVKQTILLSFNIHKWLDIKYFVNQKQYTTKKINLF